MTEKNMEQKLRRALDKAGYSLRKSRSRVSIDNFGGYMIIDQKYGAVVSGSRFDLTLDDVKDFLKEE